MSVTLRDLMHLSPSPAPSPAAVRSRPGSMPGRAAGHVTACRDLISRGARLIHPTFQTVTRASPAVHCLPFRRRPRDSNVSGSVRVIRVIFEGTSTGLCPFPLKSTTNHTETTTMAQRHKRDSDKTRHSPRHQQPKVTRGQDQVAKDMARGKSENFGHDQIGREMAEGTRQNEDKEE